ncbi:MAG TPA: hypothetical protein PLB52_00475 [Candidatus Moranbacteria bacterium]|nr:hypothetical protein [Candidatus Moranbacteria bacterium]
MEIYAVRSGARSDGMDERKKIAGAGISEEGQVLRNIKIRLNVSLESNLAKVILRLSKIQIKLQPGLSFLTYVLEGRYVDIYIRKNQPSFKIMVKRIDGEKEDPELLKQTIIDAIIASVSKMGLGSISEQGFIGRLEKMKKPFVCY